MAYIMQEQFAVGSRDGAHWWGPMTTNYKLAEEALAEAKQCAPEVDWIIVCWYD